MSARSTASARASRCSIPSPMSAWTAWVAGREQPPARVVLQGGVLDGQRAAVVADHEEDRAAALARVVAADDVRVGKSGTAQALSVNAVVCGRTGALITSWAGIVGALAT